MSAANFYKPGRGKKTMNTSWAGGQGAPDSSGSSRDITGGTPKAKSTPVNPQSHAPRMNAATDKIVTFTRKNGKTVSFKSSGVRKRKPKRKTE